MKTHFSQYWYAVTIKHDKGTGRMMVYARNKEAAKRKVLAAEGCPERAIKKIVRCD